MPVPDRSLENTPSMTAIDWKYGKGIYARDRTIVRGIVEYNRDPDHRGRVMVRVLEDGQELEYRNNKNPRLATFSLGWCDPMFGLAGGMGFGAFTVPVVGARVFVLYERGSNDIPMYFGGWLANSPRPRRYGATVTTLEPPKVEFEGDPGYTKEGEFSSQGEYLYPPQPTPYQGFWTEEQRPELPLELVEMLGHTPDTQMFFKTLKGATMMVKERDEMEEMFIIDRLGAELRFESHTELKEEGVYRRGRESATQHKPMDLSKLAHMSHKLKLVDAVRSGLEMEASNLGDDSLMIQSHQVQEEPPSFNRELMDDRLAIEMDKGEHRLRITYMEDGQEVTHITFDILARRLEVRGLDYLTICADTDIKIHCPKVRIFGDLAVEGELIYLGDDKNTYLERDIEVHGTPHRNYWPHRNRFMPYTEEPTKWGEDWDHTRGYK